MYASLRLSIQASVRMFEESDPASMQLFLLLGMMPAGVRYDELDELWVIIDKNKRNCKQKTSLKRIFKST